MFFMKHEYQKSGQITVSKFEYNVNCNLITLKRSALWGSRSQIPAMQGIRQVCWLLLLGRDKPTSIWKLFLNSENSWMVNRSFFSFSNSLSLNWSPISERVESLPTEWDCFQLDKDKKFFGCFNGIFFVEETKTKLNSRAIQMQHACNFHKLFKIPELFFHHFRFWTQRTLEKLSHLQFLRFNIIRKLR